MKLFAAAASLLTALVPVASQDVIQLHGSGTTNPSKCYWHIMDKLETQTKLPVKMTYRGVGSSTGQLEFVGNGTHSDNDFGSGDIPISAENFNILPASSVFHLPIVLGAISFFHSVPTGNENLNLTPCVLAKIFRREITEWTDPEITELNPNLNLPGGLPINVARRVNGSSSTSSITKYLNNACPGQWPDSLVGSEITWEADTLQCEGSGGMTNCILDTPGTIGYIDSGHGHAENLQEIELRNADNVYLSSKEAGTLGGIMAAADNAGLPASLDESFADIDFLNKPGPNTWPIVALSYIYVRKDLTYLENPASQALLKAFLKSLYNEEYISICEEEFGFFRITGDLRQRAIDAIDALVVSPDAPEFTFESAEDTIKRVGQGDFVISGKRNSYLEIQQDDNSDAFEMLTLELDTLKSEYAALKVEMAQIQSEVASGHSHTHDTGSIANEAAEFVDSELDEDDQVKIALGLAATSFTLWLLAIIGFIVKFVLKV